MPTMLVKGSDGAFYPVTFQEEPSCLKPHDELPQEAIANWRRKQVEETSFLKPHDELSPKAIENWKQFQNAHWQHIMEELCVQ